MKATALEFRFRAAISAALYVLGFWAPWERYGAWTNPNPLRLWSWLAIQAARTQLLSTGAAYIVITGAAILLAFLGAALRLSGTAYLGRFIVFHRAMQAGPVIAAGPYRYLRHPLYLGSWLTALAVAILMPATGALFFVIALSLFILRLIGGEETFLTAQIGEPYLAYRRLVPMLLPALRRQALSSPVKPAWLSGVASEFFPVAIAICFAAFAWDYNADLLTRCVLICFGISLVLRALIPKASLRPL